MTDKNELEKYVKDINKEIFKRNKGVIKELKKTGDLPEDIDEMDAAIELYANKAGRMPIRPGIITSDEKLEKSKAWYNTHPLEPVGVWSADTYRDMRNLMYVNDIHKPEHKELHDLLASLSEAQARAVLFKATREKNVLWVSETDLKSKHKTGKHCEEEARNRLYDFLRELGVIKD